MIGFKANAHSWTRIGLMASDIAAINAGVIAAFLVRFLGAPPTYNWQAYIAVAPWLSLATVVLMASYELYEGRPVSPGDLGRKLVPVIFLLSVLTVLFSFLIGRAGFPRSVFVLGAVFNWPILYGSRRLWERLSTEGGPTRVAFITNRKNGEVPPGLAGTVPHPEVRPVDSGDFHPDLDADVFLVDDHLPEELKLQILQVAFERGVPCLWRPTVYDSLVAQAHLREVGGSPFFVMDVPANRWSREAAKRTFDVVVSSLLLIITSPLFGLVALAVFLDDGRPVIYRQERVSRGGHPFWILKFRTLEPDYERNHGAGLTPPNSLGITRVGRILRPTHLDELPQLWNVLKGEMSLVGPRPERPEFVEQYRSTLPSYSLRHRLKPGITGVAQLKGDYLSSPHDKLHMDLSYAKRSTVWVDLLLLLQTLEHIFHRAPRPKTDNLSRPDKDVAGRGGE